MKLLILFTLLTLSAVKGWADSMPWDGYVSETHYATDYINTPISTDTPSALWHWETVVVDTECQKKLDEYSDYIKRNYQGNISLGMWHEPPNCTATKQIKVPNKISGWHCVEWEPVMQGTYIRTSAEYCTKEEGYREDGIVVFRKLK